MGKKREREWKKESRENKSRERIREMRIERKIFEEERGGQAAHKEGKKKNVEQITLVVLPSSCSTSLPGGNQVDGLPPARHTGAVRASSGNPRVSDNRDS